MSDNWIVQNLENALEVWNDKLSEIWQLITQSPQTFKPERSGDIRCLCGKCVRDYMDNTNYVVKRLDPFAKVKDRCIKCNEPGYDYLLYDRRQSH